MARWLLGRALSAATTTIAATAVLVGMIHSLPGDPLSAILADRGYDTATREALTREWQLDRPLPRAVAGTVGGMLTGDFGNSMSSDRPVAEIIGERLGPTLMLGGLTLLIHFTLGLMLGLWSALRPDTIRSRFISGVALGFYSLPSFVIGLAMVWLFAIHWPIFPPAGMADPFIPESAGT